MPYVRGLLWRRQVIGEATDESPEEEDPFVASAVPLSREQLFPTNLYRWSIKPGYALSPLHLRASLTPCRFSRQLSTLHTHLGGLESEKSHMESEYQSVFSEWHYHSISRFLSLFL